MYFLGNNLGGGGSIGHRGGGYTVARRLRVVNLHVIGLPSARI
jgi:hypothetical protein